HSKRLHQWLNDIQSDLFIIGTLLGTAPNDNKRRAELPDHRVKAIEEAIDLMEGDLRPITNFILPGGTAAASFAHLARAICRRAERRVVSLAKEERVDKIIIPYLNRISDFLFVLSRWLNSHGGGTETTWTYSDLEGAKTTSEQAQPA